MVGNKIKKWIKWFSPVAAAILIAVLLPGKVEIMTSDGLLAISLSRVYAVGENIGVSPADYAFGILSVNTTSDTGLAYFTLTNNGVASDVTIEGTNLTNGTTWTLSSTGIPNTDTVGLKSGMVAPRLAVGFSGGDQQKSVGFTGGDYQPKVGWAGQGDFTITIKPSSPDYLIKKMPAGSTLKFGIKLYMPTSVSDDTDATVKTGVITLIATAS